MLWRMRRLVLMWDYAADPLWDNETGSSLHLESLGLRTETCEALRAWVAHVDELNFASMDNDDEPIADRELEDVDAEGRRLWAIVRQELSGSYVVGYAVDTKGDRVRVCWEPGGRPELPGWFGHP